MSRGDNPDVASRLTRRRYAQICAGASVASLAGCLGDGDTTDADDADDDGDTVGAEDDTDDDAGEWDPGEPQRDTIRAWVHNWPERSNFNEWAASPEMAGIEWFREFSAPYDTQTGDELYDGHTWDVSEYHPDPNLDEISIPAIYADHEIEEPYDSWEYIRGHDGKEPLTYWDGTTIDADAIVNHERMWYNTDLGQFDEDAEFTFEAESEFVVHYWRDEDNPAAAHILEGDRVWSNYPAFHPDFTVPWNERFDDAGTEDEAQELFEDLAGERITFQDMADNEWGSGLYQLDPDRVGAERSILFRRDDHPNDHALIEEIELKQAEVDRHTILANQGEIDVEGGLIQEETGRFVRDQMPDHVQNIQRFLQEGTDVLQMNWNDQHLQNLWVRRAIVAAVDWLAVGTNGWGPERSIPNEHHVYLGDLTADRTFSEEFLDSMYTYPIESDLDLAEEWMEKAGYTRDGDAWVSPDGDDAIITLDALMDIEDWVGAHQTIEANLEGFGFGIDWEGLQWAAWEDRMDMENVTKSMGILWGPTGVPWESYQSIGDWWIAPLVGGDPATGNAYQVDPEDYSEQDNWGRPFEQQIPTELGSIEAPEPAGKRPDLEAAGIDAEHVSLPRLVRTIQHHETTEDELQEAYRKCARYANYYLPNFMFHNYTWGLFGNVRDFTFPPEGHPANFMYFGFSGNDYVAKSGVMTTKYDDDYPDP